MKFKLPFSLSWTGIIRVWSDDLLVYPWLSIFTFAFYFISFKYSTSFVNIDKYLEYRKQVLGEVGEEYRKLLGIDYSDIISQWVYLKFPFEHIIVLSNVNVEAKNIQFWARIPQTESIHFLKDLIILRCKDVSEMNRLIDNISHEFADASGYSAGVLITTNGETR
jgi:hypothetical protein